MNELNEHQSFCHYYRLLEEINALNMSVIVCHHFSSKPAMLLCFRIGAYIIR